MIYFANIGRGGFEKTLTDISSPYTLVTHFYVTLPLNILYTVTI